MRALVTGATGTTGAAVVEGLLESDGGEGAGDGIHEVLAAVRDPAGYAGPADPVRFDFTDPTTFDAFEGCEAVYLVRPPAIGFVERDLFPAVEAMEDRGVRRVVLLSVLGAEKNPILPHRRIEKRLERSTLDWTFLRAAYFGQNFETTHREEVRDRNEVFVPAGEGRVGMVDTRDVAEVAVLALGGGHERRAYDLTGPEALSFRDAARVLSDVLDRRIEYVNPTLVRFFRESRRRGHPLGQSLVMGGLYTAARLGLSDRVTGTVADLLGREPRDLRSYVADRREVWER